MDRAAIGMGSNTTFNAEVNWYKFHNLIKDFSQNQILKRQKNPGFN